MSDTSSAKIEFTVYVDISTNPATYVFINEKGVPCDGSACITEYDTRVIYNLETNDLIYLQPIITGDNGHNLTSCISKNKKKIVFTDTDRNVEKVSIILNVAQASEPSKAYPSPDPVLRNFPN